jgi:L-fuconolactonase
MRVDAHQHFWKFDRARDTWITDEMSVLRRDFLPQDLRPELAANDFAGSIAVQASQSESETHFLLDLAQHDSSILGVVGWINLMSPDIADRLSYFRQFKKLCGFRHIVQAESDDRFMLRDDFLRGVDSLAQFDFTYDILIYPRQLPAAIELVASIPNQKFVLDHMAKPEISTGNLDPWAAAIRELATSQNVHCKLSGMVTEANWECWKLSDFTPYLDVVFESFGSDRLIFGSDWPVCLVAGSYSEVVHLVSS